jgi:hypothetical protein
MMKRGAEEEEKQKNRGPWLAPRLPRTVRYREKPLGHAMADTTASVRVLLTSERQR